MDVVEVTMHSGLNTSPVVFNPVGVGLEYLVMPVQLRGV
jgi:hypothetical protein